MKYYLFSQPHQPFFAFGMIFFIIFISIITLVYKGVIHPIADITLYHTYPMIHIVFIQFFLGFLFVVFPRFLTQADVKKDRYTNIFFIFLVGASLYTASLFISLNLTKVAIIILLCASISSFLTLLGIYKKSIVKDKKDTKFVLISLGFGITSNIFMLISSFGYYLFEILSIHIGFYLFLFALIFTISQRMIPFFSSVKVNGYKINKSNHLLEIVFILLALKVLSLSIDNSLFSLIIDFSLFIFFTYEIYKWKLPILKVTPIMWVLYISLFWIPIGFFISFLDSLLIFLKYNIFFEKSVVHTLAVGYFSTILLGFGTRVVLGHSGRTPTSDNLTTTLFLLLQLVVITRVLAGIGINFNFNYNFWIVLSGISLVLILSIWSFRYLKILFKPELCNKKQ